jgi:excisionase family DNA binding protein
VPPMSKLFYSTSEVADFFKVNRVTIYRWAQEGTIKAYKIGKHFKIPLSEVERLLKEFGFSDFPKASIGDDGRGRQIMESINNLAKYGERKKLIVAIDDDENILTFIHNAMEGFGFNETCEIRSFSNGLEAVLYIGKEKPDLILLDIVMPNLNGLELAEKVKEIHKDIKIIILTGYPGYVNDNERLEFVDYLVKPVDIRKLQEVIARALNLAP